MATVTEKQLITTYNGKKINFYPNSHQYRFEGEKTTILSPSNIVGIVDKSQALLIWAERLTSSYMQEKLEEDRSYTKTEITDLVAQAIDQRNVKLEEAQDVGTIVHDYAEMSAYHKAYKLPLPEIDYDNLTEQQLKGIQSFIKFEVEHDCEYIEAEKFIYSENHGVPYVGKLDTVLTLSYEGNKICCLADFKTSKGVYKESQYTQLCGYDLAMEEEYNYRGEILPYSKLAVIHLSKDTGEPTLYVLSDEERKDFRQAFIHALHLKNINKKYNKWAK